MSRRIRTKADAAPSAPADDYFARLAKYIPAEIVALFVGANGVVPDNATNRTSVLWWIFWLCLVLTPIYLAVTTRDPGKGPLWLQVILATIAFPVWAYALGGVFETTTNYQKFVAALILMFVTFVFGLIRPPAPKPVPPPLTT